MSNRKRTKNRSEKFESDPKMNIEKNESVALYSMILYK